MSSLSFSQVEIDLEGQLIDENGYEVAYAAIALINNKNVGAYSTEDGGFLITIRESDLSDTLAISCIGYEKRNFPIKTFLELEEKKIVLKENITSLDEIKLLSPSDYATSALKKLKNSTINKNHQINALYRVTSAEEGKAARFIEYYIKILDRGPVLPEFLKYEVVERRQSADYRIAKEDKEPLGTFRNLNAFNIIRDKSEYKNSEWKKVGDTSYDDEDIIILKNQKGVKIYVGLNDNGIYKVEKKNGGVWIYNKNADGKLHLTYHKREYTKSSNVKNSKIIQRLKALGIKDPKKLKLSTRYEFIVLDVITDRKKIESIKDHSQSQTYADIKFSNGSFFGGGKKNNGLNSLPKSKKRNRKQKVAYDAEFWNNLQMPPETKFFKKIKTELEEHFGVPFEKQLELVNR